MSGYGFLPLGANSLASVTPQGVDPQTAFGQWLAGESSLPSGDPVSGPGQMGGLGMNLDTLKLGLSGLGTIGNLWAAFEARNLAKKQFNFTKDVTNTNLANSIQSYNTALEDRARSRAKVEGQSSGEMQGYIDKNKLSRNPNGV